jgi:hypothetical protein
VKKVILKLGDGLFFNLGYSIPVFYYFRKEKGKNQELTNRIILYICPE